MSFQSRLATLSHRGNLRPYLFIGNPAEIEEAERVGLEGRPENSGVLLFTSEAAAVEWANYNDRRNYRMLAVDPRSVDLPNDMTARGQPGVPHGAFELVGCVDPSSLRSHGSRQDTGLRQSAGELGFWIPRFA